ncbi:MAG: fused MFS/spermidine synthase [Lachnospiraceae bacterium]|nr:fused MFS/spermidine synthase [Lachnospiraceae bacterium]
MAVELGASRLLAPYFSSSQIVWTIIIGTIMIAMALGNIYGGRKADKNPDPDKLYHRLLIAAVWIAAIPLLGKYIIVGISGLLVVTVDTGFLIIAAFLACMVIFVCPLFLLGTVTPSLVKYTTDSLEDNGKIVGTLGAANTVGSIIGTFLPTFITIPSVGTAVTFLLFSGIVLLLGIVYFISVKRHVVAMIVCTVLFILCSVFGNSDSFAFWEKSLAYEGESVYHYLQVKDPEDRTILSTNVMFGVQSVTMKKHGLTGMYYDYAMAAPFLAGVKPAGTSVAVGVDAGAEVGTDAGTDAADGALSVGEESGTTTRKSMLILGMGTGTFARQCREYFDRDSLDIKGVEIDEKITELSKRYFDADEDIEVTTYDGRAYIKSDDSKYDIIMVDAYQDITIPFQMSSQEFFREVYDHLNDDGVMVVNLNMHARKSEKEGGINEALCDTISSVFPDVATVDVPGATNRELFAMKKAGMIKSYFDAGMQVFDVENVSQAVGSSDVQTVAEVGVSDEASAESERYKQLYDLMTTIGNNLEWYRAGDNIFTDDKAPVELLGMREIDSIIKDELSYYKRVFEEEGLEGLLKAV